MVTFCGVRPDDEQVIVAPSLIASASWAA